MLLNILLVFLGANFYLTNAAVSPIIEPCQLNDYKCIGKTLAANSNCKPQVRGFLAPKYVVPTFHFETPHFNASYIDKNLIVRNHNRCFVSKFFINKKTNRAVLSLDCPNLDLESDRTCIQHKTYLEDGYFFFHIRGTYPLIRITINFPDALKMDLCSAFIYTDVVALPRLHIDPQNKPTAKALSRDLSLLNIYERENCHARGPPLSYIYVDSFLCQYGCPIPK